MTEEVKKIYDYVCSQEAIQDSIAEQSIKIKDPNNVNQAIMHSNACASSAAYWSVKQMIEVNFK